MCFCTSILNYRYVIAIFAFNFYLSASILFLYKNSEYDFQIEKQYITTNITNTSTILIAYETQISKMWPNITMWWLTCSKWNIFRKWKTSWNLVLINFKKLAWLRCVWRRSAYPSLWHACTSQSFCFLLHKALWRNFARITIVVLLRSNCVLCRAATNSYIFGGGQKQNDVQIHTFVKISRGQMPECLPLVAGLVLYYLTRFFGFPAAPLHTVRLVRNSLRQEPTKSRSPDLSASKRWHLPPSQGLVHESTDLKC